jgi:outer membrane lipopolysaccharide assembly protein LptE/RlpB
MLQSFCLTLKVRKLLLSGRQTYRHAPKGDGKQPMILPLHHTGIVAVTILCVLVLTGCGYHLVGKETHVPPGLTSVAIPTFANQTFEPGIEVPFTRGFLTAFIQDRRVKVVDRSEADSVLEGVIKNVYFYTVAYNQSGLATEYQTTAVIDLVLKKRNGETIWVERDVSETRYYKASSLALVNESAKAATIAEIGKYIAEKMRNRFFYNF